jgi:sulfopyruvate decarboxylase subunit alpha
LVGKKPAIVMQNAGLLNSCNGIVTTGIQLELPILLIVYYAGDIGDRGFARVGTATIPVLEALGVRHYLLRDMEEAEWTLKNAWILAEDSCRPVAVLSWARGIEQRVGLVTALEPSENLAIEPSAFTRLCVWSRRC